jgi:tRNA-Thr(GGU) m(6)t(6)A37 methyltransferase TsaA
MTAALEPIGLLRCGYRSKFGVPRQSGVVPQALARVEILPECARPEAWRGLEEFSHLWLITQFHQVPEDEIGLTVRPPKLGGNERRGVFATRSPFRPNRLGLTVVKLEAIEQGAGSVVLRVSGVDLVDGTPVFDVKPYVRYADSVPQAQSSFADAPPAPMALRWQLQQGMQAPPAAHREWIEQSLAMLPQPAYHAPTQQRQYAAEFDRWRLRWTLDENGVCVVGCEEIAPGQ